MKDKFKKIIASLALVPCMFAFGCELPGNNNNNNNNSNVETEEGGNFNLGKIEGVNDDGDFTTEEKAIAYARLRQLANKNNLVDMTVAGEQGYYIDDNATYEFEPGNSGLTLDEIESSTLLKPIDRLNSIKGAIGYNPEDVTGYGYNEISEDGGELSNSYLEKEHNVQSGKYSLSALSEDNTILKVFLNGTEVTDWTEGLTLTEGQVNSLTIVLEDQF